MSNWADNFHNHLDHCQQCAEHPFELCPKGEQLLRAEPAARIAVLEAERDSLRAQVAELREELKSAGAANVLLAHDGLRSVKLRAEYREIVDRICNLLSAPNLGAEILAKAKRTEALEAYVLAQPCHCAAVGYAHGIGQCARCKALSMAAAADPQEKV